LGGASEAVTVDRFKAQLPVVSEREEGGTAMIKTIRRVLLFVFLALGAASPAHGGELLITCREEDQLVCVNAFRPNELAVNDLAFDPAGPDEGQPGDVDTITLGRPAGQLRRFEIPHLLAAGVEVAGPTELTVEVALWCQEAKWDYGVLGVYWNGAHIGSANTNQGAKKELKVFSFKAPAAAVGMQNVLWMMPTTFHRRVYLDAVKITGDGALTMTDAKTCRSLLAPACPVFGETRSLKGTGKALVLNWYDATVGIFQHETLAPLDAEVRASGKWVSPAEWKDYELVVAHGRFKSGEGEAEAIDEYLHRGGVLMMTPDFAMYFAQGAGTAWKDIPWTGGYRGTWSRHATNEYRFFGIVAQDSPLLPTGVKKGNELEWWGHGMTRFYNGAAPEEEVLIKVDSTQKPLTGNVAAFVHPVGKGKLIGVTLSGVPQMVELLRNVVVDARSE